jgi:FkbM family methyltransferase
VAAVVLKPVDPRMAKRWVPFVSGATEFRLGCEGPRHARYLYEALLRWPFRRGYHRLTRTIGALAGRDRSLRHVRFRTLWGTNLELDLGTREFALLNGIRPTEPLELSIFTRLLRPEDTFVDVGAHLGSYALNALGVVGSAGRVLAIEPDPLNAAIVRRLMSHFGVEVLELAASDHGGEVMLSRAGDLEASIEGTTAGTPVRCERLDVVLPPESLKDAPVVVKVDVERHEAAVLHGMSGWFDEGLRPIAQLEYLLDADGGTRSRGKIDACLRKLAQYRFFAYEPALGSVRRYTLGERLGDHVLNVLAIPEERLDRLRDAIDDPTLA